MVRLQFDRCRLATGRICWRSPPRAGSPRSISAPIQLAKGRSNREHTRGYSVCFSLRPIALEFGSCAASSVLAAFIALFVGWLSYLVADTKRSAPRAVCMFLTGRDTYEMEDELWATLN